MCAGSRTNVNNMVSSSDNIIVMFDNDYGITDVAQFLQYPKQPVIVTSVQTDSRLVKYIAASYKTRANLCGKSNPLCFTARKRPACSVKRKITKANIKHEFKPCPDLFKRLGCDQCAFFFKL